MNRREVLVTLSASVFSGNLYSAFSFNQDGMLKFTTKILKANVPTGNKNIYTLKTLQSLIKNGTPEFGTFHKDQDDMDQWHRVWGKNQISERFSHENKNLRIDNNGFLLVDIEILNNKCGMLLQTKLLEPNGFENICFRTACNAKSRERTKNDMLIIDDEKIELVDIAAFSKEYAAEIEAKIK